MNTTRMTLAIWLFLMSSIGFADAFDEHLQLSAETDKHYAYLLELGDDALLARFYLARQATKTIDIQTFIWAPDPSGQAMFYELYKAAERGVRVRLLIDDLSLRAIAPAVAFLATVHPNIQIKQYNPLAEKIQIGLLRRATEFTTDFGGANQRMHNKTFVVDGKFGITGGRNYQDDYFDRGTTRSFVDRDVLIVGSSVTEMQASFEEYWNHPLSINSRDMLDVRDAIENDRIEVPEVFQDYQVPMIFDALDECVSSEACVTQRIVKRGMPVDSVTFVADHPGKLGENEEFAASTLSIVELMQQARDRIVIQTPYLVVGSNPFFEGLMDDNPELEFIVSTNSLAAADHFYAYAFSYKNKKRYLRKFKWQIHEMKGNPSDFDQMVHSVEGIERSKDHYTCIHAKTYLFDNDTVWLGSFNLDPRSTSLNTEVGVIIKDPAFFRTVHERIQLKTAPGNAWVIGPRRKIPIVAFFNSVVENIFALIPIANVWPFTYSTSYELREGGTEMPFYDKEFHRNYKPVGQFPGHTVSVKAVKTRLTKAFFGPAEPII